MRTLFTFVKPILDILLPQRRHSLVAICLLTVCMGFVEMGVAGSVSLLGVTMSAPDSLSKLPGYTFISSLRNLLPETSSHSLGTLVVVMAMMCIAIIFKNIFLAYLTWCQNKISNNISWDCMRFLYLKYLSAPYIWHTQQNSADLQIYLMWRYYVSTYISNVVQVLAQLIIIVILLVATIAIAGTSALLTFVIVGALGGIVYRFFRTRAQVMGQQIQRMDEQLSRSTLGCLHGMREVHIYGTGAQFYADMAGMHEAYVSIASVRDLMGSIPQWLLESMGVTILLGILAGMTWTGASEAKAIGTLTLLAAVCWRLLPAVNRFLGGLLSLKSYFPYVRTVLAIRDNAPPPSALQDKDYTPLKTSIDLVGITFQYPGADSPALKGISLRIPKGSMVGFVGMSGSGKSTLVSILSGLYTPDDGQVLVDGACLEPGHSIRLGYVPQSLYLMDATLAENIAFSHWGQSIDRERVRECCRMAALDFVDNLPQGIDSPIGERGARLSGGQVQRVGIARALYSRPDVLIFDEATSALDGATEASIQQTILSLRSSVTMLIVAHRLTTVESCDYLYWIDDGLVRMEGTASDVLIHYHAFLQARESIIT